MARPTASTTNRAVPVGCCSTASRSTSCLGAVQRDGRTLIPTRLYWNDKGLAKLELALAKGKSAPDKRQTVADRDWKREQGRLMRDKG